MRTKLFRYFAQQKTKIPAQEKVGTCFTQKDIQKLAQAMRDNYCSCLWKKGDILLIDNRKVMHAGMPGKGKRLIRALISNPIAMDYAFKETGILDAKERTTSSIGEYLSTATLPEEISRNNKMGNNIQSPHQTQH